MVNEISMCLYKREEKREREREESEHSMIVALETIKSLFSLVMPETSLIALIRPQSGLPINKTIYYERIIHFL